MPETSLTSKTDPLATAGEQGEFCCRICGNDSGTIRQSAERMFGMGDRFDYFHCERCGCLQLCQVPEDLGRYYEGDYYSHQDRADETYAPTGSWLRRWIRRRRNEWLLFPGDAPWHHWAQRRPSGNVDWIREWYGDCPHRSLDARVLDVGCGNGDRLQAMAAIGFRDLTGVDPFRSGSTRTPSGIELLDIDLGELTCEPFDIIMFHHSLEHVVLQTETLRHVARLLKPDGACLIRIPLASADLLREYGDAWVEWDPPRHIFLHTPASLEQLASAANLEITKTVYDSTAFCYWASELYRRGYCLVDEQTGRFRSPDEFFDADELLQFEQRAVEANADGTASRGLFWIRPRQTAK